ncbi:Nicotinate-nucleotide--dimethylbenzimidazole phosphoribosyltransferase [hydrothermal vent metagenome]|uniref:Nicotinate-nucleotide--dimethylbenzimidazole phosphoribosyltransferase n=1 Tax=hydrothermal vent metagenome TaxID=652676 RepID=A0A3B0S3F8_9ZZZZ
MTKLAVASAAEFDRRLTDLPKPDEAACELAKVRQASLTKPEGSLGRLEEIALWLAGWQGREIPEIKQPCCLVFAGNHGVTAQGISAFPAEVTVQMVANFNAGGAAINQLAQLGGAAFQVIPLMLDQPTADFTTAPAMSEEDCCGAIQAGIDAVPEDADFLLLGEMGIGNSTAAAALALALFGGVAGDWVGKGTGLDSAGVAHKADVVDRAIALHKAKDLSPFDCLRTFGGRELAAIVGAVLVARYRRIPVMLDGFIVTASAAILAACNPQALDHTMIGHMSSEPGHSRLTRLLNKRPLLDLDMRLGEGSGAAVALLIVQAALAAHQGMATFEQAEVSQHD